MARISIAIVAAVLLLGAFPLRAQPPQQLITNGSLDVDASGWTLGGGCGDEQWDGANGNPPGSIRLNACGEPDSDPTALQTISGLTEGATYTIQVAQWSCFAAVADRHTRSKASQPQRGFRSRSGFRARRPDWSGR